MPHPRGRHRPGRPKKPRQKLPRFDARDLPTVTLPRQSRRGGGRTKLTNRRAAQILQAIAYGCYRETAAQLAGIMPETLCHWMRWEREPYVTFQRLVRKAEADLEARMVQILTRAADVRPELALALLERKFPERWGKVHTIVASPPPGLPPMDLGSMLERILARNQAMQAGQPQLPPATIIEGQAEPVTRPHDPRPPKPVALRLVPRTADDGTSSA